MAMTEVAFHFNVADKWGYVCRLLRKAAQKGSAVTVAGEASDLQRLDHDLWTFSAVDFVPHCRVPCEPVVLEASPIVLCEAPKDSPHQDVLINLGASVAAGFERFERLIEVVGTDEADRAHSRQRWKHYRDRGYAIVRHEIAAKEVH